MNRKFSLILVVGLVMLGLGYFGGPGGASILDFGSASAQNTKSGSLPGQDNPKSKIQNPNLVGPLAPLTAVGSSFAYQGRMNDGSAPANASYDFTFKLFDALSGGNQVGSTYAANAVMVTSGLFTVPVSFGDTAFLGETRYLEVAVRRAGVGNFTTLYPRQPITPAPYANSVPWFGVSGKPTGYNPLRAANGLLTPDGSSNVVGSYTAIATGADGLPIISYYDSTGGDLKVAHCDSLGCSNPTISTPDSAGNVGRDTAITIGADGLPIISYYDVTNGNLKTAHCSDRACMNSTLSPVDNSANNVGQYTAITIGSDGLPLISYYDATAGDLKVAHCADAACGSAAIATLDSTGVVGQYTSVAIGANGRGLISYYDATNGYLVLAYCANVTCSSTSPRLSFTSANTIGQYASLAIGADGEPIMSYYDFTAGDLKVTHCAGVNCAGPTHTVLDSTGDVGQFTSINIGADGLALIGYYDATPANRNLKIAHCANRACTNATISTVDNSANDVGQYASLAVGLDGLPVLSYFDVTSGDLKALHCASPLCVSYQRRR